MARATLSIVQRIVYENLGISPDVYGTLQTNKRYKTTYIDDAIQQADFRTSRILISNKQDILMEQVRLNLPVVFNPDGEQIDQNWSINAVDITQGGQTKIGQEISYGTYEEWALNGGSIYDETEMYFKYAIKDYKFFFFGSTASIWYYDFAHQSSLVSLKSPAGFESALASLASAILLEKRNDNPEQAKQYRQDYAEFMQPFLLPETNLQEEIETP